MKTKLREIGDLGEAIAEKYLKKKGYSILARNYIARGGEIDIVGFCRGSLVYFEVKSRTDERFGAPRDAVDSAKLARIESAAVSLKAAHCRNGRIPVFYPFGLKIYRKIKAERIDVIEIYLTRDLKLRELNHIKDMEHSL